jgi:hypothetical protein
LLVGFVLQLVVMNFVVLPYDEGLSLYGAVRVLHGQLPYRDFWTMYGPGEFYVLAGAFRLFGVYALWGRVLFLAVNSVSLAAVFYVAEELTQRLWWSLGTAAVVFVWLSSVGSYEFPVYPALTLILIAAVLMLRRWRDGGPRWAIYAGLALGIAALFRHDLALYALVALCIAAVFDKLRDPAHALRERRRRAGAELLRLVVAAAAIVVPVVVLLLVFVPAHDLYYGLLYVPARIYPKVRALPFPHLREVLHGLDPLRHLTTPPALGDAEYNIVWFPPIAVAMSLVWFVPVLRKRELPRFQVTGYLALFLLTALLFLKGIVRVAPLHMLQAVVPAIVLLGCSLARWQRVHGAARAALGFSGVWLAICVVAASHRDVNTLRANVLRLRNAEGRESFAALCHPPAGLRGARCLELGDEEAQAILYVERHTEPDDKIYVGAMRHDKLFANDIAFYFFSARESATKWHDLHPGVETTAPIQRQMISDLEHNHAAYVIREPEDTVEPNGSNVSSGVRLLDDYIEQNYRPERSFGEIEILRRTTPFTN